MSAETVFGDVAEDVPTLKLTDVTKEFGRVQAVRGVSLTVRRNEVLGLIGENGAGKSSLLKILTGIHQPDRGSIEVNGTPVDFRRPQDAAAAGIGVVHQEQSLFTNLSVAENIAMNGPSRRTRASGTASTAGARSTARPPRPSPGCMRTSTRGRSWATCRSSSGRWWRSPGRCGSTRWSTRPRW